MDAHLAPLLFVSSKEFANLIHQTGVLLFPPEPESALPWGARCSHASCCCCWWRWPLCLLSSPLPSYSKAHSAKTRLCCSFRVVCSPSDAQGLSLKVSFPWPKGTMGHTEGQVGEGGGGLHWWCPWFWLSSRHSLELQWLCQSLPPSAWARPLFLSPSASPRPQGQQGLSLSLNSHPDAKQPEALWGHCCIGPIYLLHALCLNWMYSHQIKKRKDYGVKETKTYEHRPIICLHSNKINLRWLCTLHLLRFGVFKPKPLKSSSYFSLWLTGEQDLCHGLENCSFML